MVKDDVWKCPFGIVSYRGHLARPDYSCSVQKRLSNAKPSVEQSINIDLVTCLEFWS